MNVLKKKRLWGVLGAIAAGVSGRFRHSPALTKELFDPHDPAAQHAAFGTIVNLRPSRTQVSRQKPDDLCDNLRRNALL